MEKIEIKIINKSNNPLPIYARKGDSGMDLQANDSGRVMPHKTKLVKTGLFVEIPEGYEIQIRPRSGLAVQFGISILNSPGTIDCVTKGTKIKIKDSFILVEDLYKFQEKKVILSFNTDKNIIEEDLVSDMWLVQNVPLIEVEMEDGTKLKIPKNKEVYSNKGWKPIIELNSDDTILMIE